MKKGSFTCKGTIIIYENKYKLINGVVVCQGMKRVYD